MILPTSSCSALISAGEKILWVVPSSVTLPAVRLIPFSVTASYLSSTAWTFSLPEMSKSSSSLLSNSSSFSAVSVSVSEVATFLFIPSAHSMYSPAELE